MKEPERYLGATYSDSCQKAITTKTPETLPIPEVQTIIPDTRVKRPTTDADMTHLEKNNIDEVTCQKLRKKYVYENDMQKIYNILVYQTNDQLHDNSASEATLQVVKTGRYPIGYLMIPKKILF